MQTSVSKEPELSKAEKIKRYDQEIKKTIEDPVLGKDLNHQCGKDKVTAPPPRPLQLLQRGRTPFLKFWSYELGVEPDSTCSIKFNLNNHLQFF